MPNWTFPVIRPLSRSPALSETIDPNDPATWTGRKTLKGDVTDIEGLFPVGDTTIVVEYEATVDDGRFQAEVTVEVVDEFKDALDIKDWFDAIIDLPGGTTYPIGGKSSTSVSGPAEGGGDKK